MPCACRRYAVVKCDRANIGLLAYGGGLVETASADKPFALRESEGAGGAGRVQRCVGPGFIHAKGWRLDGACRYYCQNDALIRVVMRQIPSVKRIPSGRSR